MARLHVKITEYVHDDDPAIAAAARAAYDATLHLHRLVQAWVDDLLGEDPETSGEVTTAGTDEESQPDLGEVEVTSPEPRPVKKRIPYSLVRAWAIENGCDYGHNARPPKAIQDAYLAATSGITTEEGAHTA